MGFVSFLTESSMRRVIVIVLSLVLVGLRAYGEKPSRLEFSAGAVTPLSTAPGYGNIPFLSLAAEYRYEIPESTFSIGFENAISGAARKVLFEHSDASADYQSCRTLSFCLTGDYRFRTERLVPFIGIGAGVAQRASFELDFIPERTWSVCANPRCGVILGRHFRVTLEARLTHRLYNTVGLRLGYCFGL